MVGGLLANVGMGIVLPTRSSPLAMTQVSNVDLQKRFPVIQVDSMFQEASVCRVGNLSNRSSDICGLWKFRW